VSTTEVRTYYGTHVVRPPAWNWEVPCYFFTGGLAGASSALAAAADLAGHDDLARVSRRCAAGAAVASPALLISDLGRPARFLNMVRVVRPTSPMNLGAWLLLAYAPLAVAAGLFEDRFPRLTRLAGSAAALGGPVLATYTAVLVSDTAIPVWHEAARELPFVFGASSLASAGAAAAIAVPPARSAPARRAAVAGAAGALTAMHVQERRLGPLARPYHEGPSGALARAARALLGGGAAALALGGRRRPWAVAGGVAVLAGALLERWSVFRAGFASAEDPTYVVGQQLQRSGS
jgi:Polysulphide reductase, NrfD